MNRIRSRKATKTSLGGEKPSLGHSSLDISQALASRASSEQPPHALFAPLHYERNYAYPLIIWLHGRGDDHTQLRRIMPHVSLRNYVAVAPQGTERAEGPLTCATATDEESGSLARVLPCGFEWRESPDQIHRAEQTVLDCLGAARSRFHVAADRVFLAGYDCGGTMALRLALREPRRFAGVLSLGGRFPVGHAPLARLAEARHVSIWLACNRASQRYPSAAVCDDLRLIHSAGMSIMLREYPGTDSLTPQMLTDMDRWLMEQITGSGVTPVAQSISSQTG